MLVTQAEEEEVDWANLARSIENYTKTEFSISDMIFCRDLYIGPIKLNIRYDVSYV